jgi:hypothetical protein
VPCPAALATVAIEMAATAAPRKHFLDIVVPSISSRVVSHRRLKSCLSWL